MSGHGAPRIDLANAQGLSVTIVAGMWHEEISEALIAGALRVLERAGVKIQVIRVPGSFELPVVTQAALRSGADAAVALGVIIRSDPRSHRCRSVYRKTCGIWPSHFG